jgi:hypothetical protein
MEVQTNKVKPSSATLLGLIVSYCLAYLYTFLATNPISLGKTILVLFSIFFCIITEMIYHRRKTSYESGVWFIALWLIIIGIATERNTIWGEYSILFSHAYAVYWLLSRSGTLMVRESSWFLPLDAFLGFVLFPLKHFFLRLKTLVSLLSGSFKKNSTLSTKISVVLVLLFSVVLLYTAGSLLASADNTFHRLLSSILDLFRINNFGQIMIRLLISLPIGAYLYGLLWGTALEDRQKWDSIRELVLVKSSNLRKVPNLVWIIVLSAFSLLYLAFFTLQGSYLFGAFWQRLPENFTAAQYARQGFFELCAIMTLNFTLLGVIAFSNEQPLRDAKMLKAMATMLLTESLLFAGIAFSKLYLYIQRFGYTPLRLQSTWLVLVLFVGILSALYTLQTGKKSMRFWILYSGITLSILNLF